MKMRRKGFLAALLAGIAAPVLAKVGAEPRFPRFFVRVEGAPHAWVWRDVLFLRVDDSTTVIDVYRWPVGDQPPSALTLLAIEAGVRKGLWKEITAAEARVLRKQPQRSEPMRRQHVDALFPDDIISPNTLGDRIKLFD